MLFISKSLFFYAKHMVALVLCILIQDYSNTLNAMKKLLFIPVLLLLLLGACSTHGVSPEEIKAAQRAIQNQFSIKDVTITIMSNKRLQVGIPYSPLMDTSRNERQRMADSIGIICKEYLDKESLTKGSVVFVGTSGYISNDAEKTQGYKMHL